MLAMLLGMSAFAQDELVKWSYMVENLSKNEVKVIFTGRIAPGYHTYTLLDETSATEILDAEVDGGTLRGGVYSLSKPVTENGEQYYKGTIVIAQNIRLKAEKATYTGTIFCNACRNGKDGQCKTEYYDFEIEVKR